MSCDINPLGTTMYLKELDRQAARASSPALKPMRIESEDSSDARGDRLLKFAIGLFRLGFRSEPRSAG